MFDGVRTMNGDETFPILRCDALGRDIFGKRVLEGVSFALDSEHCLAVIGPNGAGKTTLIRVCLGVLGANRGSVRVFGRNPRIEPHVRARCGVATEESAVYPHLSALENLILWGHLFGMRRPEAKAAATRELECFGAAPFMRQAAGSLSAGQR